MNNNKMITKVQSELAQLTARLGPAPLEPRPADEARDIYSEIRFGRDRRAYALAAVCYWCGIHPTEVVEAETGWA